MLSNIVNDVYNRMAEAKPVNEEHLKLFLENMRSLMLTTLEEERRIGGRNTLRMSSIGKADRKIWLELNKSKEQKEFDGQFLIRMLYGNIVEELLLLLVREAGYSVTDEQKEVVLNGVKGHIDCKINGYVVDIKSASDYGFRKFKNGFHNDDDFGYIGQLSGYVDAEGGDVGFFLAMNKSTGELALLEVDSIDMINASGRIDHLRFILSDKEALPPPCEEPKIEKSSGNKKLPRICRFCEYKQDCWPNLRGFKYSRGVTYFTEIFKEPRVEEVNIG